MDAVQQTSGTSGNTVAVANARGNFQTTYKNNHMEEMDDIKHQLLLIQQGLRDLYRPPSSHRTGANRYSQQFYEQRHNTYYQERNNFPDNRRLNTRRNFDSNHR